MSRLWLAGVTGTNGKTTVSPVAGPAMTDLGLRCGVIGTLGTGSPARSNRGSIPPPMRSPCTACWWTSSATKAGAAAMEVSSIGLDQGA